MLDNFRKYTQGWVATIMGIILSLAFVFWGIENYLSASSKKHLAAKVNHIEITDSELNLDYQRALLHFKSQLGPGYNFSSAVSAELKKDTLNKLILQAILLQAALKSGFQITPYHASAIIKQMPEFLENNQFSRDRFKQIIAKLNYSQPEFIEAIQRSLLLNQVASGITATNFLLPHEQQQILALLHQTRDIEYAIIPMENFKKNTQISDSEIENYYQHHTSQFLAPAKVKIEYLQLSIENLKKNLQLTEKELTDNLSAGSHDSKQSEKLRETLISQKAEEKFLATSDKLTDLTYTNPTSLQEAARTLGLKVESTDYFTSTGGTTPFTKNQKILMNAFSPELIAKRSNSNLIETTPGNIVVLRVKDYKPESVLPLKEVKNKIMQVLLQEKESKKAQREGERLLTRMSSANFIKIINQAHLPLFSRQGVTRTQKNLDPEILRLAFIGSASAQAKVIRGAALHNGDYAIVQVNKVLSLPDEQISEPKIKEITIKYPELYGNTEYNLYKLDQMKTAKVRTFYNN